MSTFSNTNFNGATNFIEVNEEESVGFPFSPKTPGYYVKLDAHKVAKPSLRFLDVEFSDKIKLTKFNVARIDFDNCDISKINFSLCDWSDTITNERLIFPFESTYDGLQNAENIYRQLKQNFTKIGNWELAGYAYVSEMEMRMKRYWKNKKYHFWIFYAFYKYLGGYTQDFIRPIMALAISFITFSIAYFFIDFDISNAFQRSIAASVPYIEIQEHVQFQSEWLILRNIQFILSLVLISFFVLALRKRFKL